MPLRPQILQAIQRLDAITANPAHAKYNEALNCIRLLTRLIPFSLEDPGEDEPNTGRLMSYPNAILPRELVNPARGRAR